MANKNLILEERDAGMTYNAIAKKHGLSRQRVGKICEGSTPKNFHFVTEKGCIYPNLRAWMNENKVSRSEFIRRTRLEQCPGNERKLSLIMSGKIKDPKKSWIDEMIAVTGMSYECLFDDRLWEVGGK